MKNTILTLLVLTLVSTLYPITANADVTDLCDRVAAMIDNAEAMVNRSAPVIMRSGNQRAINMLNQALSHMRAANSAYNNNQCRAAFSHIQSTINLIRRALRIINRVHSY